eukprot:SAG11_NODE_38228_length_253_cov_0.675325_1_plen_65_part_01
MPPAQANLAIPRELLRPGVAYNITVQVLNAFGSTASTYAVITTTSQAIPSVTLPNAGEYIVHADV